MAISADSYLRRSCDKSTTMDCGSTQIYTRSSTLATQPLCVVKISKGIRLQIMKRKERFASTASR